MSVKENFLKEIKSATPVHELQESEISLVADMEQVLAVRIEDHSSHNIPFIWV